MNKLALQVTASTLCLVLAGPAWGQAVAATRPMHAGKTASAPKLTELTVSAAEPPEVLVRWTLLPPPREMRHGNAALAYQQAINLLRDARDYDYQAAFALPLDELAAARVGLRDDETQTWSIEQVLWQNRSALRAFHDAARYRSCDWQRDISKGFALLMPDLQYMRRGAQLLMLDARWQMAQGDYKGALRDMQTALAMGRHLEEGVTLIEGLVGIAVSAHTLKQFETLMQQPDAPNLYWALAELPSPPVRLNKALRTESDLVYLWAPELAEATDKSWTAEQWRVALDRLCRKIAPAIRGGGDDADEARALITGLTLVSYPRYKKQLIASGLSAEEVEKMPVAKVVFTQMLREYDIARGEMYKWFSLPYHEARRGRGRDADLAAKLWAGGNPLAMLIPALDGANMIAWQTDRQVKAFRVIEAVRHHAATHGGKLPASLDDITDLSVPDDPMTGEPFLYKVEGNVFYVECERLPGVRPHQQIGYKVTLRPPADNEKG